MIFSLLLKPSTAWLLVLASQQQTDVEEGDLSLPYSFSEILSLAASLGCERTRKLLHQVVVFFGQ